MTQAQWIQREFDFTEELQEKIEASRPVDKQNWRHGHRDAYVFEADGKHWKFWIDVHHSEGWDLQPKIRAVQVQAVEKVVMVWENVPAAPSSGDSR